jgi:hypothetical protein
MANRMWYTKSIPLAHVKEIQVYWAMDSLVISAHDPGPCGSAALVGGME